MRSIATAEPIRTQNLVYQSSIVYNEMVQFFAAEDLIRYRNILSTLHIFIEPSPIANAVKMLALRESGVLDVVKLGQNSIQERSSSGMGLDITYTTAEGKRTMVHHDYVIDALGQCSTIKRDPSPLYQSILEQELAKPVLVRFRHFTLSKAEWESVNPAIAKLVVEHDGQCYYDAGGLLMDLRTYRLIPGTNNTAPSPIIYGMGPITYGQVAFPQDLTLVSSVAERVVEELETDFELGDNIRRENQHRTRVDQAEAERLGLRMNGKGYLSANMRELSKAIYEIQPKIIQTSPVLS